MAIELKPISALPSYSAALPDDVLPILQDATGATKKISVSNLLKRLPLVTVGDTGADYVVDGTADDVQIQEAIEAVDALGGGTVFVKEGIYNLVNPIDFSGIDKVTLTGEGVSTIFKIPEGSLANFTNAFMITCSPSGSNIGSDITIEKMLFEGGYTGYTAPSEVVGGGVAPGTRWVVKDCEFKDFNYFALWLGTGCTDSKILRNRFNGPGRGADTIGGGGSVGVEIASNIWEANLISNAWDNVGGSYFDVHDNVNKSLGTFYIEGMTHIDVHHNTFTGTGSIVAKSDNGYAPPSISNSRYIKITDNTLAGGSIDYVVDNDAVKTSTVGGDVDISHNLINTPPLYGILLAGLGYDTAIWGNRYVIANNIIINANGNNTAEQNIGYGIINPSSINIAHLFDIVVSGNVCVDTRVSPRQIYGIQIGQLAAPSAVGEPNHLKVSGNHIRGFVTDDIHIASPTYTDDCLIGVWASSTLAGTKVYYVSDTSGGAVTRKLTFVDGVLISET
jgi:hypothetical protein